MCDVAIFGAGPYGLSAAAHLSTLAGLEVRIFGEPMSFWQTQMPRGMYLRSNWPATHIAAPAEAGDTLGLAAFGREEGRPVPYPAPLEQFVRYGLWYQRRAVPQVERRSVRRLEGVNGHFRLQLEGGETVEPRRVIVAAGIGAFARRPPQFDHLPKELVSHTAEHQDLARFAGRSILVVGSGQSALESAALLHENGAEVEIIARAHNINWLQGFLSYTLHHRMGALVKQALYAPTDVGPAGLSQLLARPALFNLLPRGTRDRLWKRAVRPAGARWLLARLQGVPILLGRNVTEAAERGGKVRARLDDGSERVVDHLLLGTGYRVDIARYGFWAPELLARIEHVRGYPTLGPGLETSVPGLHIVGAPAARSFGPIMQFVSGTRYASPALLRFIARHHVRAQVRVAAAV